MSQSNEFPGHAHRPCELFAEFEGMIALAVIVVRPLDPPRNRIDTITGLAERAMSAASDPGVEGLSKGLREKPVRLPKREMGQEVQSEEAPPGFDSRVFQIDSGRELGQRAAHVLLCRFVKLLQVGRREPVRQFQQAAYAI